MASIADNAAQAQRMFECALRVASAVQAHEHVLEQARELAARRGDVGLVNIIFPDTALWATAELDAARLETFVRWAQCALARAALADGGRVRRELMPRLAIHVNGVHSRVETHSHAAACALPYSRDGVKHTLAHCPASTLMLATSFESRGSSEALIMSPHLLVSDTSAHVLSPTAHTHACAVCATSDGISRCGACKQTYYCSSTCQRQHRSKYALRIAPRCCALNAHQQMAASQSEYDATFEVLKTELAYQRSLAELWAHANVPSVEAELLLMHEYVRLATTAFAQERGTAETLKIMRKLAGIAFRCMHNHAAPPR